MSMAQYNLVGATVDEEFKKAAEEVSRHQPDFPPLTEEEAQHHNRVELADSIDAGSVVFLAVPAYHKGGKGRFTRLDRPCEFEFKPGGLPRLITRHCKPGSGGLAVLATILTAIAVHAIVQVTSFMVGPGFIVWYWILRRARIERMEINLGEAQRVVCDDKKQEIAVLGVMGRKWTWVGVKCPAHYESVVAHLEQAKDIPLEKGSLKTTQLGMLILLAILVALLVFVYTTLFLSM
jgi:hypothetical protein